MSTKESRQDCFGAYPVLWRVRYKFNQRIVRSVYGTGEVETVGTQIAEASYDVVATTAELAKATFQTSGPHKPIEPGEPEFICYVDAIVHVAKNYGGHFS